MQPIVTAEEMRRCDTVAIAAGIPVLRLMENAATGALSILMNEYGSLRNARILVLCGKGNNGGDGLAFARLAKTKGAVVTVGLAGSAKDLSGEVEQNLRRVARANIPRIPHITSLHIKAGLWDIIVDALLGTGAVFPLREPYQSIVETANNSTAQRFALDLPTGVGADGEIDPHSTFNARWTATFGALKPGLLFGQGRLCAGRQHIVQIGLPPELLESGRYTTRLIEQDDIISRIPLLSPNANKYTKGKVFLLCGSAGMMGAPVLAANAAMRSGAGITIVGVPATLAGIAATKLTESMVASLPDDGSGIVNDIGLHELRNHIAWASAVVIGCGISKHESALATVRATIQQATCPIVLDADGLSAFANHHDALRSATAPIIITPHVAELGNLCGIARDEIVLNPIKHARAAAAELNVIVVLKGGPTVIATPGGIVFVNPSGNPGMATAGAGDVLSGMIGALLAQGCMPLDAALCGVFLHGRAGDIASARKSEMSMIASDIVEGISEALRMLPIERVADRYRLPQ